MIEDLCEEDNAFLGQTKKDLGGCGVLRTSVGSHFTCGLTKVCTACNWKWAVNLAESYMGRFAAALHENPGSKVYFVTLTIPDRKDLRERFERLKTALSKLHRWQQEANGLLGWARVIDIVPGRHDDWHAHVHALILVDPSTFDPVTLRQDWIRAAWQDSRRHSQRLAFAQQDVQLLWAYRESESTRQLDVLQDVYDILYYAAKFKELTPPDHILIHADTDTLATVTGALRDVDEELLSFLVRWNLRWMGLGRHCPQGEKEERRRSRAARAKTWLRICKEEREAEQARLLELSSTLNFNARGRAARRVG